jgi:hypothetical protein
MVSINASIFAQGGVTNIGDEGFVNCHTLSQGLWSSTSNQAGLAFISKTALGFDISNLYNIPGLYKARMALGLPLRSGGAALSLNADVYGSYRNVQTGLSYAKLFSGNFSVGMQLSYNHIMWDEKASPFSFLSADIGIIYPFGQFLLIAMHCNNVSHVLKPNPYCDKVDFSFGIGLKPLDRLLVYCDASLESQEALRLKSGFICQFKKRFILCSELGVSPLFFSLGSGFQIFSSFLMITYDYNFLIGSSPEITLVYDF